jgi:CheY-like chemotaxis protein
MTRSLKLQASLKILKEQRGERRSIPVVVLLTGRNSSVTRLQAVDDNNNSDEESEYLRRDFWRASYMVDFSELYENNKNDEAYQLCRQELEELLEQALAQPQSEVQTETQSGKASKEMDVLSERAASLRCPAASDRRTRSGTSRSFQMGRLTKRPTQGCAVKRLSWQGCVVKRLS